MAFVLADRVRQPGTAGTGNVTFNGSVSGYRGFVSGIGVGNSTYYCIVTQSPNQWEVGIGTVLSGGSGDGELSRDQVLASSNSDNTVNFGGVAVYVFCDYPAGKSVNLNTSGQLALSNNAVTNIKTATFNSQTTIATTSGSITIDWTSAQNQKQTEPTGTITYSFTAPPGPCHLQLFIDSDGTSTAQTINWPGSVTWFGAVWAGANNKKAIINFWYDGTNYYAIGSNQV